MKKHIAMIFFIPLLFKKLARLVKCRALSKKPRQHVPPKSVKKIFSSFMQKKDRTRSQLTNYACKTTSISTRKYHSRSEISFPNHFYCKTKKNRKFSSALIKILKMKRSDIFLFQSVAAEPDLPNL